MALHIPPLQYHLKTDEEVEDTLCTKGLKVVEIYSEWCGPCKSVIPTFKRIRLDKEDESTLLFTTVCAENCTFLADSQSRRGLSEPTFLFFRNGVLKEKVFGSNTPKLSDLVQALTPAMADADDLEENPLVQARREREKKEKEAAKEAAREAAKKKK